MSGIDYRLIGLQSGNSENQRAVLLAPPTACYDAGPPMLLVVWLSALRTSGPESSSQDTALCSVTPGGPPKGNRLRSSFLERDFWIIDIKSKSRKPSTDLLGAKAEIAEISLRYEIQVVPGFIGISQAPCRGECPQSVDRSAAGPGGDRGDTS
jgi:hypothetical protein